MVGSGWGAGAASSVDDAPGVLTAPPDLSAEEGEDEAEVDELEFVIKSGPKRWMTTPDGCG